MRGADFARLDKPIDDSLRIRKGPSELLREPAKTTGRVDGFPLSIISLIVSSRANAELGVACLANLAMDHFTSKHRIN